jgi:hypothetical protein
MEEIDFRSLQYANVVAVVLAIAWNSLVNILPLNNVNTGFVSDSYPNLFTPPGYVFAIWGVIYTLAIIFMVYQVRPSQRCADYLWKIGRLYLVSSLINVVGWCSSIILTGSNSSTWSLRVFFSCCLVICC